MDAAWEIKRLQRSINDLIGVLGLTALWNSGEPAQILSTFLDALLRMLDLEFVYARVKGPVHEIPIETIRLAPSSRQERRAKEFSDALHQRFGDDPQEWPSPQRIQFENQEFSTFPMQLGLQGEIGLIVAGAWRAEFPEQTERLILSVAANQAAIGLQHARLLSEQKRVARDLDRHVALRTAELAAANEELRRESAERILAEAALRKAQSEIAHVGRVTSLGTLAATIAHEVNQPLSGIVTNASTCLRMLSSDPPNVEGARETARRTIRDGNRASEVVTRLRALFRKKPATNDLVDLNEATREVVAVLLSELQQKRVILRQELADDLPLVRGDRVQLQQVIFNLLRNASDAMHTIEDRPRQMLVKTGLDGEDRALLTVRDSGVGFDPQGVETLFEAFQTTKIDGMGIGLSVSRSIIESHHGRLWASLNDGPGATFSFSIPRARASLTHTA